MTLLTLFFLLIVTCIAFWLFSIAYKHAGAIPAAPAFLPWALQDITIIVLIVVVCAIWGIGGGYVHTGDLRLQ